MAAPLALGQHVTFEFYSCLPLGAEVLIVLFFFLFDHFSQVFRQPEVRQRHAQRSDWSTHHEEAVLQPIKEFLGSLGLSLLPNYIHV